VTAKFTLSPVCWICGSPKGRTVGVV